MSNPQSPKEISEYLSGQRMATTQAIIGTLGYIKNHIPNGDQIAQVISAYLESYENRVQRSDIPPPVKQGFQDGVKYIQQELNDSLTNPNNPPESS